MVRFFSPTLAKVRAQLSVIMKCSLSVAIPVPVLGVGGDFSLSRVFSLSYVWVQIVECLVKILTRKVRISFVWISSKLILFKLKTSVWFAFSYVSPKSLPVAGVLPKLDSFFGTCGVSSRFVPRICIKIEFYRGMIDKVLKILRSCLEVCENWNY